MGSRSVRLAKRFSPLMVLIILASAISVACGGSAAPANAQQTQPASSSTEQAVASAIATETGTPVPPQLQTVTQLAPPNPQNGASQPGANPNATLTMSYQQEDFSYDPQVDSEGGVYMQVWSPLLSLTPDNKVAQSGAQSMQVSNGGKTYTFTLRKMMYSDGTPVTASDYAFAMQRVCDPTVAGTYSNVYYDIVGCEAWRSADPAKTSSAQLAQLKQAVQSSIKAIDPNTLQVQLKNPAGYFPYVMTLWMSDPVRPSDVASGKNWWQNTANYIGDGPFKVVSHTPNQQWVLQRNPYFTMGKPGVAQITIKIIQTPATALLAYQKGELDMYDVPNSQFGTVAGDAKLKNQLIELLNPSTQWIELDVADPPFNKLQVRQAFAFAMNRDLFIKQVNDGFGQAATTLLYPGIPGYQTTYQQSYDPAKAKQLLSQAGYPDGKGFPTVNYYFANNNDLSKKVATFWADQFKQILNVNIVPTPMDPVQLGNLVTAKSSQVKMTEFDWYQDYPHAQDWLSLLFADNSGLAPRGWNDPKFNALTDKADALPVGAQSTALYQQADAYLAQNGPALFYDHTTDLMLVQPYVKGYSAKNGQVYGFSFNTTFAIGAIYETQH
ncbi:MAG TPA: peptide ABC transporter substrate-binding protein [Thermomicrobiaceae bacterium]|nr:peptide ABC transporter substrate-binding protein [Thermomicrobiaceae bacterium]